ncbi:hypothetical protein LJC42_04555 [Eubacteriales bacterium OttesenSCG-928-K08]|nr:hypothetical protein [Eubacteriales bacterium OttesenSCG-928-K08]
MDSQYVIAYADKSILKISGLKVRGLNTRALEQLLFKKLNTFVRVIGVTGEQIEMDAYNVSPETVRKNADGFIDAIALAEGVTVTELVSLSCSEAIREVDFNKIPSLPNEGCAKERWMQKS